jgi:hypothetical protein
LRGAAPGPRHSQGVDRKVARAQVALDAAPAHGGNVAHQRRRRGLEDQARHIALGVERVVGPAKLIGHSTRHLQRRVFYNNIQVVNRLFDPQQVVAHDAADNVDGIRDGWRAAWLGDQMVELRM